MKIELLKQLQEAGFQSHYHDCGTCGVQSPTLDDLIEECNGQLGNLYQTASGWGTHQLGVSEPATFGSTPTEAVALLWLKLNKK